VSAVSGRLVWDAGAGGVAWVAVAQPSLLVPVALAVAVLGRLPLLLITTLALAAVYSRDQTRRVAAEKILGQLLSALRLPERPIPVPRRKSRDRLVKDPD
jgi:hypothetical protein